jgi:FlaA1/EpsC-like NDP-sugar epimerase
MMLQDDNQEPVSAVATGRSRSLFGADIRRAEDSLRAAVTGQRILAIGAAGSIGSSTITFLADWDPACLHVVDQNENALTEFVRGLRGRPQGLRVRDFHTLPLDCGSPAFRLWLHEQRRYDLILNFAAIKHVRSEKDAVSTLQMFDTNLRKQALIMGWLAEVGFSGRYFSVSTDKAANPSSMMGATKRVMEHVLFDRSGPGALPATITSARFANVAFSNGSLLQGFQHRLARGEPLAAPRDTRRYFVSIEESGEICALAASAAPDRSIVIPRLDPRAHLILLEEVAARFLRRYGLQPRVYEDEDEARRAAARNPADGFWPLLLTPLDTSGEKPYEEFVAAGESTFEIGLPNLLAVAYEAPPPGTVARLIDTIERLFAEAASVTPPRSIAKDELKAIIGAIEPAFLVMHRDGARSLDQRL